MRKLWFSLFDNDLYQSNEPAFVDVSSIKGIKNLEDHFSIIYNELVEYLKEFDFHAQFNTMMTEKPKTWKVRSLKVWGVDMYEIQKHFPETIKLLDQIPDVLNVGFNLLEPGAKIRPHSGDTNANYRCHLGLKVPANPTECVMKVKNEIQHWQKGKVMCFTDAFEHSAANNSNEQRIILLFDILKPEFKTYKLKICATVLMSFYLQQIGNRWKGIYTIKRSYFRYLLFPFIQCIKLSIPIRNFLKRK